MLEPKDKTKNGYIMEFKVCREDEDIMEIVEKAKKQIEDRGYNLELASKDITSIVKMVYVFRGKDVELEIY